MAAVGGGTPTQTNDHFADPGPQCSVDEQPHTVGVCRLRGARRRPTTELMQAARLRALDVGDEPLGLPVVEQPLSRDRGTEWSDDSLGHRASEACCEDVDESRSAVGLRREGDLVVRPARRPPFTDGVRGLDRRERVAERIRRYQDSHSPHLCSLDTRTSTQVLAVVPHARLLGPMPGKYREVDEPRQR